MERRQLEAQRWFTHGERRSPFGRFVIDHGNAARIWSELETLVKLVRSGKAFVKISGAYRSSSQAPDYPDVAPLAKALIAANPKRILWGTDWPHPSQVPARKPTEISPLFQIDDGRLMNQLALWVTDAALRKTILVDNPAMLYGF